MVQASTIIRITILVLIIGSILKYKIPLPCHGCEKESIWYRCLPNTGHGTKLCESHKFIVKQAAKVGKFGSLVSEQLSEFTDKIWEFDISELPEMIGGFLEDMKMSLFKLKDKVAEKINIVIEFLKEKVSQVYNKVKQSITNVYDDIKTIVIDPIISFMMKRIIEPFMIIINQIIKFRDLVWKTIQESYEKVMNLGVMDFAGEVVDIAKNIPEAIENVKGMVVNLLNNMKSTVFKLLNGGLAGGANGINKGVNAVSGGIDKAVGKVIDGINGVMDIAEKGVGGMVGVVNKSMNGIEKVVNKVSDKAEDTVNTIIKGVNKVDDAFEQAADTRIAGWKPLGFLSGMTKQIDEIDIATLDIPDIDKPDFITIGKPDIPDIDINAPVVKEPEDLDEDALNLPSIPGFGFVSSKIASLKLSITNIFETAMAPLYDAVAIVISVVTSLTSSMASFYNEYFSIEGIKLLLSKAGGFVTDQFDNFVDFIKAHIIPPIIRVLKNIKDPIVEFVGVASEKIWTFLKAVGSKVSVMLKKAYDVMSVVAGKVARNVFAAWYYMVGLQADTVLFFLPVSVTTKILIVFFTVMGFLAGPHLNIAIMIYGIIRDKSADALNKIFKTISDTDIALDKTLGFL